MTSLPRNPSDSGLVALKLKRKKIYKNVHKYQVIDTNRVIKCLRYFIKYHPSYKNCQLDEALISRCQEEDPSGYNLLHTSSGDVFEGETNNRVEEVSSVPNEMNLDNSNLTKGDEDESEEDGKNDNVRNDPTQSSFIQKSRFVEYKRTLYENTES